MTHQKQSSQTPAAAQAHPEHRADLTGRIALVAGATRGAGRAIARELGRAGATVYVTGRSTSGAPSDYGRPETIEQTAELITAEGGTAHAVVVDHLEMDQVRNLIARIEAEQGRLDVLVNDIGGEAYVELGDIPLWQHDHNAGRRLLDAGLLTHLNTSHAALGLMVRHPGALVVEVTDGTREYNRTHYREALYLDLTKTAVDRLAFAQGHELAPHHGTAISVSPGWLRSEMMLDHFGVTEENWRESAEADSGTEDGVPPREFVISETPTMLARGVAALAADPRRSTWNSRSTSSYEVAQHYGLTDVDGSRPDAWSYITALETVPAAELDVDQYR